jgi:transposase InsO family protein
VREFEPVRPNSLWVSDITYISVRDSFAYLSLITDAYSHKIVGFCLRPTLKKEGPLLALEQALSGVNKKMNGKLYHHSDRGLQYCCGEYINRLDQARVLISMTEKGDPYENAVAERVNGILKSEFLLDRTFVSFTEAKQEVEKAINVYNNFRPHDSCDKLTPIEAHQKEGYLPKHWKKKKEVVMG